MYSPTKDAINDLKQSANTVRNEASKAIDDVAGEVRSVTRSAGDKLRQLFNCTNSEISHAADTVSEQIHNKPVQSTLIALGAGFLLGVLMRR
ncbi:MAG: hypothetical protein K2Q01_09620 [Rickettsiales bacterium]|nr:hypothetical protein [Rickettsiales bacterium]